MYTRCLLIKCKFDCKHFKIIIIISIILSRIHMHNLHPGCIFGHIELCFKNLHPKVNFAPTLEVVQIVNTNSSFKGLYKPVVSECD